MKTYEEIKEDYEASHSSAEATREALRYIALRKLLVSQFAELSTRCQNGESFDAMVDAMIVHGFPPPETPKKC